jgi:hypothetical protein
MDLIETRQRVFLWRLVSAIVVPLSLESAYLIFTRWPSYRVTALSDYASWAAEIIIGPIFIATLPIRLHWRILWVLVYIPVMGSVLFYFSFCFIAVIFHDAP